jgi:hypothetical protein
MVGEGLLELEQREHIRAVTSDGRCAIDVTNTAKQEQQCQQWYEDIEFHGLFKEHKDKAPLASKR